MRPMILLTALLALTLSVPAAAVPMQLTHSGRLADSAGVPLEDTHALTVSIYPGVAGGSPVWTETLDVAFEGGNFSIVLGTNPSNPLNEAVLDGSVRYVTLAVGSAPEMPQRIPLTSVPYAVRAGVAMNVSGGIADVSEVRINGTTVINASGQISAPVAYADLTGVPEDADTLAGLACTTGQIALFNGLDWACGDQAPATVDVTTLSGTIDITNLPVGGGANQVAAGDHAHSFGQITGIAAISQLPTGTAANQVARGDHGHTLVDLTGDLPIARTTGDLPISRVSGTVPVGQLPTGTAANQVALGNHNHVLSALTGDLPIARVTGDLPFSRVTGDVPIARVTGSVPFAQLPVGTSSTTVARGDHSHTAAAVGAIAIGATIPWSQLGSVPSGLSDGDDVGISGTGATGYLPAFTGATTQGNSPVYTTGGNVGVGIGANTPRDRLHVDGDSYMTGGVNTQSNKVQRDFVTYSNTASDAVPIHIKTNIRIKTNTMFRILVEGYNYGRSASIMSDTVGYTYVDWACTGNIQNNNYASGVSISHYCSSDGFVVVKLDFSNGYFIGFSASAWFTNPTGTGHDITATVFKQSGNL